MTIREKLSSPEMRERVARGLCRAEYQPFLFRSELESRIDSAWPDWTRYADAALAEIAAALEE